MADVPSGGAEATAPVRLLREKKEAFVEEPDVGERSCPDEEERADEPVCRDLACIESLVGHVLAEPREAGQARKHEGLSRLPDGGGEAADRVLETPVRPELNRARHADLGPRVHGLHEIFEGARHEFDVGIQEQYVAASCLQQSDVVSGREAHVRDPCDVHARKARLDRVRRAVGGPAVDEKPFDGDVAERGLHGVERLERTLASLVRDDDDRDVRRPRHGLGDQNAHGPFLRARTVARVGRVAVDEDPLPALQQEHREEDLARLLVPARGDQAREGIGVVLPAR